MCVCVCVCVCVGLVIINERLRCMCVYYVCGGWIGGLEIATLVRMWLLY